MRKLNTGDAFKMFRIIKSSGLKGELENLILLGKSEKNIDTAQIGIEATFVLIEAMSDVKIENAIYEFLGDITNKDAEKIKELPINDIVEICKEIIKMNDIKSFFSSAVPQMKN